MSQMDLERHDFQLDELVERIKANDNRLVALQVPEGLKMQALEMMDSIEDGSSAKVILAADPCYGACDLVHDKMRSMGVELVAHMGHSQMNIDSGMPTHFIPVTYDGDPELAPAIPFLERHRAIAQSRLDSSDEEEELDEVAAELDDADPKKLQEEIGDLLFAITNLARHLDVDPEQAIEQCNQKFLRRFQFIETQIIQQGKSLQTASLDELDGLWDKAKLTEKKD